MINSFHCLFISYALLGEDHTSHADLIPMSDLKTALDTSGEMSIKLVNLSTLKFVKAECKVVDEWTKEKDAYIVHLDFGPTDHNIKEDIEQGVLTLVWDQVCSGIDPAIFKAPTKIMYRAKGETNSVFPEYAYLKHANNRSKYFMFINYKGASSYKEEIFYVEEFEKNKEKFAADVYAKVFEYVKEEVDKLTEFSVGTRWPNPWPKELHILYDVLQDETQAGYFLSGLVQKAVMESPYEWSACKVRLYNRERRTLYFYRTDKLKELE